MEGVTHEPEVIWERLMSYTGPGTDLGELSVVRASGRISLYLCDGAASWDARALVSVSGPSAQYSIRSLSHVLQKLAFPACLSGLADFIAALLSVSPSHNQRKQQCDSWGWNCKLLSSISFRGKYAEASVPQGLL